MRIFNFLSEAPHDDTNEVKKETFEERMKIYKREHKSKREMPHMNENMIPLPQRHETTVS